MRSPSTMKAELSSGAPPSPARLLAEPRTVLRVHQPASRSGSRRRRLEDFDLAGLRVDAADVLSAEHEEVTVVPRVGNDVVHVRPRNLVRLEHLERPRPRI